MSKEITEKIDKINQEFYKIIFSSFDQTRRHSWDTWQILLQYLPNVKKIKILDLGCGNGRFAEFLAENLTEEIEINYTGLDLSKELLNLGEKHLLKLKRENFNFEFIEKNILENDLNFKNQKFDLIVLFGVMHHIYDENSRIQLFNQIKTLLSDNGKFIFTTWQFLENERQKKKILNLDSEDGKKFLQKFELKKENFKQNDRILSWEREVKAFRYCHNYTEQEINDLSKQTNFKIEKTFLGDGKEGNLNKYCIFTKKL